MHHRIFCVAFLAGTFGSGTALWAERLASDVICPPCYDPCMSGPLHPEPSPCGPPVIDGSIIEHPRSAQPAIVEPAMPIPGLPEIPSGSAPVTPAIPESPAIAEPAPEPAAPSANDYAANLPSTRSFSSGLAMGGGGVMDNVGGYIDDAVLRTRFRMRYDSVDGGDSDRAEFLYGTYNPAAFGGVGPVNGPARILPRGVDYEEISVYWEQVLTPRFAAFVELPVRWNSVDAFLVGAGGDPSANGLADMNVGFKYALRRTPSDALTFQFKVIIPTGDADQLMGTGNTSLMPGLLYREQVTDRITVFGELHDWIALGATPIGAGDPAAGDRVGGNVLRYGLGIGYDLVNFRDCCGKRKRLTWVNETVGWTVLQGYGYLPEDDPVALANLIAGIIPPITDRAGDTIVNFKTGVRYTSGINSLYVGYGFAMTEKVWYDDIIRVQWERFF